MSHLPLLTPQGEDRAASVLRALLRQVAGDDATLALLRRLLEELWPAASALVPPPKPVRALPPDPESKPAPDSRLAPAATMALPIKRLGKP